MREVYKVTIRGRKLEGLDLRQLLARAVREKRNLDERLRIASVAARWNGIRVRGCGETASTF